MTSPSTSDPGAGPEAEDGSRANSREVTDQAAGHLVAEQLRQSVRETMQRRDWPVSGSFDVVTCVDPSASGEAVLALADKLMYAAKREGQGGLRHAIRAASPAPTQRPQDLSHHPSPHHRT